MYTLYVIPGSHACRSAMLMLEHKGIPYRRVDVFPVMSRVLIRAFGFSGNRVPALKIDGRRIQGTREISRELERLQPRGRQARTAAAAARQDLCAGHLGRTASERLVRRQRA
jgi:glutathione S-transferase